jgi:hypothetical protein
VTPRDRQWEQSSEPAEGLAASGAERGHTVTASLEDGPLRGLNVEVDFVEGRPPKTIDLPGPEDGTCRYCLAAWVQSGPRARYTFLYLVE